MTEEMLEQWFWYEDQVAESIARHEAARQALLEEWQASWKRNPAPPRAAVEWTEDEWADLRTEYTADALGWY